MTAALIITIGLLAANALYVAAEFGAVGVRRSRVRRLAEDGSILARRLLPYVEDAAQLDRYVAASQIGITLSSLILGAYAQAAGAGPLAAIGAQVLHLDRAQADSFAVIVILLVLTAVQVIAGELIPKSLALQFPTQVALGTVWPMLWSLAVFRPVISVLNGAANALLRVFGGGHASHRHLHSPQEIALLLAESRDGGLLEADEHKRLQRALQLGMRTAGDLMVPLARVTMVSADTPWTDLARVVSSSAFSRLPVYRGARTNIVGIIRVKDAVRRYLADPEGVTTNAMLSRLIRQTPRVPHALAADRVIGELRAKRAHAGLVIDDDNTPVGLITIHDVVGELLGAGAKAAR